MKLFRITSILALIIVIFSLSCNKKDKLTTTPKPVTPNTYVVTTAGSIINDTVSGASIVIPPNATNQTLNITISKSSQSNANLTLIGGNSFPVAGDIYKIETNLKNNLDSFAKVTLPYNPDIVSNPENLEVAYYSDFAQKWVPADLFDIDVQNHKVSFYTLHFSIWSIFSNNQKAKSPSDFSNEIITGFIPKDDAFPIINNFPTPWDLLSNGTIGNCAGISLITTFYYKNIKSITGKHLWNYAYKGLDPNVYWPYPNVKYYNNIYEGTKEVSEEANKGLKRLKYFINFKSIWNTASAANIYNALMESNGPIVLAIEENKYHDKNQHAVFVYKYEKNPNGTGTFYYCDPNIPGIEKTFTHNANGSINPFIYLGTHTANYLNPSPDFGNIITVGFIKYVIDTYFTPPTKIYNTFSQVACGSNFTIAIMSDGSLWSWGQNDYGQLGDGTFINKSRPVCISNDRWKIVSSAGEGVKAIKSDGTLWGWGRNDFGGVGDGTDINRNRPTQIGSDNNWMFVSSTGGNTLAIKTDGSLWTWGTNGGGQIGNGGYQNQNRPIRIGTDKDWKTGSCDGAHSLAIKSNGTLWAWGSNEYGQLGDGTTVSKTKPTQIGNSHEWSKVFANFDNSFAIKKNGTLWAWGNNEYYALGDGTNVNKATPIQIGRDNNWKDVQGVFVTLIALKSDGTLYGWGSNSTGILGKESATYKSSMPVRIGSDNNWQFISSTFHVMAIKSEGTLWSWGNNQFGQLGDGRMNDFNAIPNRVN